MPRTLLVLALVSLLPACATTPTDSDPGAVAAAYAAAGRHVEAAREIDVAVRAHPNDVDLRQQAATIHAGAGDPDQAVGHLGASPMAEKSRQNVADAYIAYRRASELAPEDIRAISGLALTADSLGFADEARVAYARWAELELQAGNGIPVSE